VGRRFVILGPPGAGKSTQSEDIVAKYGVVPLHIDELLQTERKQGSDLGKQLDGHHTAAEAPALTNPHPHAPLTRSSCKAIPDALMMQVLQKRLASSDCQKDGWLLDDFPRTSSQAVALLAAGICPTKVIFLQVPTPCLLSRVLGRRVDPQTGKIYHLSTKPPDTAEVSGRLQPQADSPPDKAAGKKAGTAVREAGGSEEEASRATAEASMAARLATYQEHKAGIAEALEDTMEIDGERRCAPPPLPDPLRSPFAWR
jgi:adenylate kinase family enzyme